MKPKPRYQPGDRIGGRYQVHKALMGGMGEVYLCLDLEEMEPYALKTFQQRYLTDSQRLRRAFEQEVATWVALEKHPNIVRCFWMQVLDNQPFMALEWIAGEEGKGTDLRSWLRHGPLDLKLALQVAIDICNGLIYARSKQPGLVHRDLKPENILMAQGGLAKITDFGLAEIVQTAGLVLDQTSSSDSRQSLVGKRGVAGTPAYMAPEQWRGEALDERTDIYALGCILYELLNGRSPFVVDFTPTTPQQMEQWLSTMRLTHETQPAPRLFAPFTPALDELVQQCLGKQQSVRPQSLGELANQLTQLYRQQFGQLPVPRPAGTFTAVDYSNRGATYDDLHRYDLALADYGQAITLDPNNADVYANRGLTYHNLQRNELALADFGQAIALNSNNARAYSNRGLTYHVLQRYELAFADFGQAIALDPKQAKFYYNRGITHRTLQQYEFALADYGQAIALDSTYARAYSNRGLVYYALQQYELALADFSQAIALDPNLTQVYSNRGVTHAALQQHKLALADFKQAIALDATYANNYYHRGLVHVALQEYKLALADFEQTIVLAPNDAEAYFNRGSTHNALQEYDLALADFEQAIILDPSNAKAFLYKGITLTKIEHFEEALTYLDRAAQLGEPDGDQLASIVRQILEIKSDAVLEGREGVLADYNRAIKLDPNSAQAYYNRGVIYAALGRREQALSDYSRAIELDPNFPPAFNNRGGTYAALGRREQALADYSRAVELDPNYAQAYVNLGALLGNQGKHREALPYFEQAARLGDPTGAQYAAQVKQRLGREPTNQINPLQQAFEAFQQATSLEAMRQAVTRFPLLLQTGFMVMIEQAITQQLPAEHRPAFEHRLAWLRQIAKEQNQ